MRNISKANVNRNRRTPTPHANCCPCVFLSFFFSLSLSDCASPPGHKFPVIKCVFIWIDSYPTFILFSSLSLWYALTAVTALLHSRSFSASQISPKNQPVCLSTQLTACFQCILLLFFFSFYFSFFRLLLSGSGFCGWHLQCTYLCAKFLVHSIGKKKTIHTYIRTYTYITKFTCSYLPALLVCPFRSFAFCNLLLWVFSWQKEGCVWPIYC